MVGNQIEQLEAIKERIDKLFDESQLLEVNAQVDYHATGVQTLFQAVDTARRYVQRIASISGQAHRLRGATGILLGQVKAQYQDAYDQVVIRRSSGLSERLSWEEKASIYRVGVVDEAIELRKAEQIGEYVSAMVAAIEARSRAVFSARVDLMAQFTILEKGDGILREA